MGVSGVSGLSVQPFGGPRTVVLQPDAMSGWDTWLANALAVDSYNYGIDPVAPRAGTGVLPATARGLIQFDLSAIPAGCTVLSATLALYCESEVEATDYNVAVHRALTQWYEGQKNAAPPDMGQDGSTWLLRNANGSVPWAGGAGGGSGSDYAAVATATTLITAPSAWYKWNVTADVAAWVGGAPNYGWWCLGNEGVSNTSKRFTSSDGTAANRPKLTVAYR